MVVEVCRPPNCDPFLGACIVIYLLYWPNVIFVLQCKVAHANSKSERTRRRFFFLFFFGDLKKQNLKSSARVFFVCFFASMFIMSFVYVMLLLFGFCFLFSFFFVLAVSKATGKNEKWASRASVAEMCGWFRQLFTLPTSLLPEKEANFREVHNLFFCAFSYYFFFSNLFVFFSKSF